MYICILEVVFFYYNYNFEYTACYLEFLFVCSSLKIIYQLFQRIQVQLVYLVVILMPLPEARETTRICPIQYLFLSSVFDR
jgi:hypothetical protein